MQYNSIFFIVYILFVLVILSEVHTQPAHPSLTPTSPNGTDPCTMHVSCPVCTAGWDCVWCVSDRICVTGYAWGTSRCSDWMFRQCSVDGIVTIVLFVISIILLLVLIFVFYCVCYKRRKGYKKLPPEELDWDPIDSKIGSLEMKQSKRKKPVTERTGLFSKKKKSKLGTYMDKYKKDQQKQSKKDKERWAKDVYVPLKGRKT